MARNYYVTSVANRHLKTTLHASLKLKKITATLNVVENKNKNKNKDKKKNKIKKKKNHKKNKMHKKKKNNKKNKNKKTNTKQSILKPAIIKISDKTILSIFPSMNIEGMSKTVFFLKDEIYAPFVKLCNGLANFHVCLFSLCVKAEKSNRTIIAESIKYSNNPKNRCKNFAIRSFCHKIAFRTAA